jgi:hypothetical protein
MKAILDKLVEESAKIEEKGYNKETENNLMDIMEDLRELLSHLDAGLNFTKMGGVLFLLDKACVKELPKSFRYQMLSILMEIAQNNDFVQKMLINNNFTKIVPLLVEDENDTKMHYRVIGALRGILGGKNIVLKRIFLESSISTLEGKISCVSVVMNLLMNSEHKNTLKRGFLLLEDLYRFKPYMTKKMDSVPNEKVKADVFPNHEPFMEILNHYEEMDKTIVELVSRITNNYFENKEEYALLDLSFKLNFFYLIRSFGQNVSKTNKIKESLQMMQSELKSIFKMMIFTNKSEELDPELKGLITECNKISKTFN